MEPLRIVIAEDDRTTREGLTALLALQPDIEVVAAAEDGGAALYAVRETLPDVLLTDIQMPVRSGIEITQILKQEMPRLGVVVLTIFQDDENVFAALRAGAAGYVLKDSPPEETLRAVQAVARGESILNPAIAARVLVEFTRISAQKESAKELFRELSERELEVLREVATGKRNREIGEALFISEKTVKNHISNILFKLQCNDRTEAAMLAVRSGIA